MKAKNLISAVSALAITASAMAACVSVSAADEEVILKGQHVESKAGGQFTMNIDLAELNGSAKQGFSGCEFAIEYDPAKITIDEKNITEGIALSRTNASAAELATSDKIKDEVVMVNGKDYNCFDYNLVKGEDKNTLAVLWCTGLESSKYWVSNTGCMLTISGTVYADAREGEEIPVTIKAIERDGNEDMVFGYVDGKIDKVYSSAVAQQGLVTVVKSSEDSENYDDYVPFWGDVNVDGTVNSQDVVAMIRFMAYGKEESGITNQGIVNGNLFQAADDEQSRDFSNPEILGTRDLSYLKQYLLEDITADQFPITEK